MIKIEITGENPLETMASMAAFCTYCLNCPTVSAAANAFIERESGHTANLPAPVPTTEPPYPPSATPREPAQDTPPWDEPAYTVKQVQDRAIAASRQYGQQAVKACLSACDASHVSTLDPSKYSDFVHLLDKLNTPGDANA